MIITRGARPERDFTIIANGVLRDERLSFRARGVLSFLLSFPEGFQVASERVANAGKEGRDAIRTCFTELEQAGYLQVSKQHNALGHWETVAIVSDYPSPAPDFPAQAEPAQAEPAFGFSGANKNTDKKIEEEGEGRRQKSDRRVSRVQPTVHAETGTIELMVDASLVAEWGKAFPAVDVQQAIARATGWLNANPANRKSNYERFLFNWLTREQDRAPRMATPQSAQQRPAAPAGYSTGRRPVHDSWLNLGRPMQPPRNPHDDNIIDITPG